jgi:hypothetical protein
VSSTTWYVIDTRTNEIVNAIEAHDEPGRVIKHMLDAEHLRLDKNPPLSMLEKYRYWNERP